MVPNSVVLGAAVVPLREPGAVDLRARLRPGVKPSDVQALLEETIDDRRSAAQPHIALEEVDGDEVVVRIQATPEHARDGPQLADEVLRRAGRARWPRSSRERRRRARDGAARALSACSRWPVGRCGSATLLAAEQLAGTRRRELGREARRTPRRRAARSGATSTSARSRSIARTTRGGDVARASACRRRAAARRRPRRTCPRRG